MATFLGEGIRLPNGPTDPVAPVEGNLYFNTGTLKIRMYTAAGWVDWA